MNWFGGSIAEAVSKSKVKNAIFVVFVEGTCDESKNFKAIIDDAKVRSVLETEDFIAIKISSVSEAYYQFARIYKIVPIPSVFFIGSEGAPLEIITSSVKDTPGFLERVHKALVGAGKVAPESDNSEQAQKEVEVNSATPTDEKQDKEVTEQSSSSSDVTLAKPIQEQSVQPEQNRPKLTDEEAELYGPTVKHSDEPKEDLQTESKEKNPPASFKIKPAPYVEEKPQEDQGNAANQAELNIQVNVKSTDSAPIIDEKIDDAMRSVRVQFRFKNGDTASHTFTAADTFKVVRAYVKEELIPGTGIRGFILTTVYPKRELKPEVDNQSLMDLELFPSCALLIIEKDAAPSTVLSQSSVYNIVRLLICTLFAPIFRGYNYLRERFTTQNNNKRSMRGDRASPPQRIQPSAEKSNQDGATKFSDNPSGTTTAYRRFGSNIHRLNDHREDSDDENATWNGNSTQQK